MITQINSAAGGWWNWMWPMLWQVGILIVFIGAIDFLLRRRIWPQVRYALWLLVLVKLILPPTFSLSTSVVSHVRMLAGRTVSQLSDTHMPADLSAVGTDLEIAPLAMNGSIEPAPDHDGMMSSKAAEPAGRVFSTGVTASVQRVGLHWKVYVMAVWLAGVIVLGLWAVVRFRKLRQLHRGKFSDSYLPEWFGALLTETAKKLGLRKLPGIVLSQNIASPAVFGTFRPVLVLPADTVRHLSQNRTEHILLHELAHIKRRDLLVNAFYILLQIVYWFNPLLWLLRRRLQHLRELCCDATVARVLREKTMDYRETILETAEWLLTKPARSGIGLLGLAEDSHNLLARLNWLEKKTWKYRGLRIVTICAAIALMTACVLPMARAQKDDTIGSTFEGQLEPHKPLAVGLVAGTAEHPELVRIEWIRFETTYGNAWGVTARVGWLPATDACWRLKVELLDDKGQVLRHSRDLTTVFTTKAGGQGQAATRYADLDLKPMHDQGRRHARRFRVHLEHSQEQIEDRDSAGSKTHALEIVVVDQESKAPIADAAVVVSSLYLRDTYRQYKTLCSTDSQGRCHLDFARNGLLSISVNAQKPGFASGKKSWSNRGSWPIGQVVLARVAQRHVLEMVRAGSVGGIVQDTEGNPIDAVEVRFTARVEEPSGTIGVSRTVQTDANGRWQVEGIPSGLDRATVGLRHPEYGGDKGSNRRITGQALLDAHALKHIEVMQKGQVIAGKVLDDRGEPVASATVMMASRSGSDVRTHAITDESGAFELAFSADTSANRDPAAIIVEVPGYAPAERTIGLKPNADPVEFRLKRGRSITCRVVDTAGKPVVGAVTVVNPLPENVRYGVWLEDTDSQGIFQVPNAPRNDIRLTVMESGYIAIRDFVVGQSEDEVVITMKRDMRVHGTVTDAQSGRPMPNFEIAAVNTWRDRPQISELVAFAEGTYELIFGEARSEPLKLQASAVGYEPATSQEFRIDEGQRTIDFKLARSPTFNETTAGRPREEVEPTGPRRITGVVRDGKGRPVSGAVVSTKPRIADEVVTNAEGVFTLTSRRSSSMGRMTTPLREETTHLIVRHKERNLAAAMELDDNAETVDIKLIPGVILSGKVVDVEGKGIPDAEISLTFWSSGSGYGTREVIEINSDGYYQIRAVPSGHRYSVTATAGGHGQQYVLFNTAEAIDGGMELEPLVLAVADLSISGVVVDVEDKPVAGARVYASGRGQPHRNITTDDNGKFLIENMCKGRIRIQAQSEVPRPLLARVEADGGATDIKIVLAEISGRRAPRQAPSLVGKTLPELRGISVVFSPEQHKDKMILVCFWDMNQRPSRNCISQLAKRSEQLGQKGVTIVAIQASKVDENALDQWIKKYNISFPSGIIGIDEKETLFAWGVKSLPWLILTDRKHIVRAEGFGLSELDAKYEDPYLKKLKASGEKRPGASRTSNVESTPVTPSDIALLYHSEPDVRIETIKKLAASNDIDLIDDLIRAGSVENYTPVHNEYGRVLQSLTRNRNVRGKGAWKSWLAGEAKAGRLKIEYLPIHPDPNHQSMILSFALKGPDDFDEMATALTAEIYDRRKCLDALRYMVFNDHLPDVQKFMVGDWLHKLFSHKNININDIGYFLNGLANPGHLREQINSQICNCLDSDNPIVVANALNLIAGVEGYSTRFLVPDVEGKVEKLLSSSVPEVAVQAQRAIERIRPSEKRLVPSEVSKVVSGTRSVLQRMIDSAQPDGTVIIPKGVYTEPVTVTKPLTLKGESRNDCIFEVTSNQPAISIDTKGKGRVIIEAVTIKWQLATSDRAKYPFAVAVKDTKAQVKNCCFLPLGNFKRCPVAINAVGFSELDIDTCRFEGFEYTVCFGQGTKGTIHNSLVMGSGHQGISLYSGATAEIIGNVVTGSRYHAVRSTGGTLNMTDNLIINNANRGVYLGNKSARGTIANNVIIGNGTGIGGFARSNVKVENNIIADSSYAGIGFRDSCSLSIRDNIFRGNERGWILFKEGSRNSNTVYKNTFWQNKVDAENMDKTTDSIIADPDFVDANNGDFSLKPGPALQQKQGLTNPGIFKKLWEIWQTRDSIK